MAHDLPHRIDVLDGLYIEGMSAAQTDDDRYEGGVFGWFCIEADDEEMLNRELATLGFTVDEINRARGQA